MDKVVYVKCHSDCVVHQAIKASRSRPSRVCEWCENGICVLDTSRSNGGMSLEAIGIIFGITRERVRQIEDKALKKLAKNKNVKELFEMAKNLRRPEVPDHFDVIY